MNMSLISLFKGNEFELNAYPVCLENISKNFAGDNKKQNGLSGYVCHYLVNYGSIGADEVLIIHKYLVRKNMKSFLELLNKYFYINTF